MSWFTSLSLEQRQRKEALREARRLAFDVSKTADSQEILALAEFILNGSRCSDNEACRRDADEGGEG